MAADGRESPGLTAGTWKRADPGFVPGLDEEGHMVAGPVAPPLHGGGTAEDPATRYLREIRNWMRFIGIIVIINVVASDHYRHRRRRRGVACGQQQLHLGRHHVEQQLPVAGRY